MFKIEDGRNHFFQWDLNRRLIIEDASVTQVHFCNKTDDCSLVCEVYEENGQRLVNVPNILLQTDWRIRVYAYDSEYTKHEECYRVYGRTKPADYVYTETEVLNYNTLLERMDTIDANIGEAVQEYLEENPIETGATEEEAAQIAANAAAIKELQEKEVDLTGYATEDYVDDAIASIPSGEECCVYVGAEAPTDDSKTVWIDTDAAAPEYARKGDIPSLEGYATEEYVDNAVANIDIPTGGGDGAKISEIKFSNSVITNESKAELQEYVNYYLANNKTLKPNTEFTVKNSFGGIVFLTEKQQMSTRITLIGYIEARKYKVHINFSSSTGLIGSVSYDYFGEEIAGVKDWNWVDNSGYPSFDVSSYTHVRLVVCPNDNIYDNYLFDVHTTFNNTFAEESGQYYNVPNNVYLTGDASISLYFRNGGGQLFLESSANDKLFENGYQPLGFYYWG